ncbi:MAG: GtrA family protein [Ruminococcus sp.]|uniref:GtrA family protein n=1 Tax=Ruminococcus sp. TaxID=41978 RepID=UPI002872D733|nr:GtrA family protein [Ruminococcus sp.]MBQ3285476.1 GtrA family protein [Ruminococcus sp.]
MKEFLSLLAKFKLKELFFAPTKNNVIQFFRYCFVGGIATVVEGAALWLIQHFIFSDEKAFFVYLSQAIAFVLGTVTNFILSRLFVFQANEKSMKITGEFIVVFIISAIGLLIKEGLLWCFNIQLGIHYMLVWIVSTALVLIWNYVARRVFIYKK